MQTPTPVTSLHSPYLFLCSSTHTNTQTHKSMETLSLHHLACPDCILILGYLFLHSLFWILHVIHVTTFYVMTLTCSKIYPLADSFCTFLNLQLVMQYSPNITNCIQPRFRFLQYWIYFLRHTCDSNDNLNLFESERAFHIGSMKVNTFFFAKSKSALSVNLPFIPTLLCTNHINNVGLFFHICLSLNLLPIL